MNAVRLSPGSGKTSSGRSGRKTPFDGEEGDGHQRHPSGSEGKWAFVLRSHGHCRWLCLFELTLLSRVGTFTGLLGATKRSLECICNNIISLFIKRVTSDGRVQELGVNQIFEYKVIAEKMLGSWLPKCNNLYDNIYQRIVIEFSVCAQAFEMKTSQKKKEEVPNTCQACQ